MAKRWHALFFAVLISLVLLAGCGAKQTAQQSAYAHYGKAMSLLDLGNTTPAIAHLQKALELDPYMYHAWYQLGLVYRNSGDELRARYAWEKGVEQVRRGPERDDYPKSRSLAEMQAGLAGLEVEESAVSEEALMETQDQIAQAIQKQKKAEPKAAKPSTKGGYAVLYSSNLKRQSALTDSKLLGKLGYDVVIKVHKSADGRTWHRVWVGCCASRANSLKLAKKLTAQTGRKGLVAMRMAQ